MAGRPTRCPRSKRAFPPLGGTTAAVPAKSDCAPGAPIPRDAPNWATWAVKPCRVNAVFDRNELGIILGKKSYKRRQVRLCRFGRTNPLSRASLNQAPAPYRIDTKIPPSPWPSSVSTLPESGSDNSPREAADGHRRLHHWPLARAMRSCRSDARLEHTGPGESRRRLWKRQSGLMRRVRAALVKSGPAPQRRGPLPMIS